MTQRTFIRLGLALALMLAALAVEALAQVPPVGPSGPTGWCTDANGRVYRC